MNLFFKNIDHNFLSENFFSRSLADWSISSAVPTKIVDYVYLADKSSIVRFQYFIYSTTKMSENSIPKIPNLDLANYRFILNNPKTPEFYDEARTNLFKCIEENSKYS